MMADATNNSGSNTSGEPIPQWKKELLQRRKNLAKTIGTAATQVHDSASTVAAALTTTPTTPRVGGGPSGGSPFGNNGAQKDPSVVAAPSIVADTSTTTISVPSESATSPTPSASNSIDSSSCSNNNNNNDDSPASPPAATTPTSLFGAPVFVGHSPPAAAAATGANEPPQSAVLVKSVAFVGGGSTTNTVASSAATRASEVPLHATPQSHSNDGPESTSCSTSRSLLSHHLHSSNSGASSGGPVGKYAAASPGSGSSATSVSVDCELTRPSATSSGETSSNSYSLSEIGGWKSKKNTSSASSSSSSPKMVAASAEEIIYEKNSRFGGEGTPVDVDPSEELKYGPGIVSKLRCRYLSLALRQSANKQRPSLNNMRRATSLNNLLDEEGEDLSEREQSIEGKDHHVQSPQEGKGYFQQHGGKFGPGQTNQMNYAQQQQQPPKAKTPDEYISTFQKSVQNSYTRSGRQTEKKNEYNRYNKQRGADSLKRARSVEALVRYDHKAWERDIQKENLYSSTDSNVIILDEISCTNGTTNGNNNANNCQSVAMNKAELITDCVTIEEKIINGREKGDPKPKRLTSFIDADERPPPDVVRQTMKIFEANANRRGRPVARTNGAAGEVAAKVASYKSIISHEKPPITHPKPPLSPKKPNIIPRTTSPTKPNGISGVPVPAPTTVANGLKDKPNLPKLDINVIRTNLETTNNLKNSVTPIQSPNHNNNITTSTPLAVRVVESQTYRLKYDSPALSPNNTATAAAAAVVVVSQHKVTSSATTTNGQPPESPRACMQNNTNSTALAFVDSPSIPTLLASKLNHLNIVTSTPTSTRSPTPQQDSQPPPQPPPRHVPPIQYATSDEEDPDDPEDQQHEYSINNSDRDDDDDGDADDDYQSDDLEPEYGDDEYDYPQEVKKVSRSAMDNISKAGVTTQFRFNGPANKSHLPALGSSGGGGGGGPKLLSNKKLNVDDHHHMQQQSSSSSNSSSSSSSPITVPAAAAAPVVVAHKPPVPLSRESLGSTNGLKPTYNNNNNSNIGSVAHNASNVSNSQANTNHSVSSNQGSKVVINDSVAPVPPNVSVSSDVKTVSLTAREIEKNQINLEKSEESFAAAAAVGGVAPSASVVHAKADVATTGSSGGDFFMAKWGGAPVGPQKSVETVVSSPAALVVPVKKKVKAPPPPPSSEANTMVFNFSDRKEVPDYIENDGIILRPRPRELPKPGESGFVVLGDLTLETSTDPDDSWAMGPPSPCDVEFANANIVINGKSSMRNKTTRDSKFKIQFDDSLTSTFEYPSETSLLEANGYGGGGDSTDTAVAVANSGLKDAAAILASVTLNSSSTTNGGNGGGQQQQQTMAATADSGGGGLTFSDNGLLSHKNNLLSSMPLGSAPFASYTPVKAAIDTNFELGVTRTPSPSSTASSTCSSNSINATHNNDHHNQQQSYQSHQQQQHQHHNHSNGHHLHHHHPQHHQQQQHQQHRINGTADASGGLLLLNGGEIGEPESIQYLKPASDEQTVNWSQGTRVTDLLF